MATEGTYHGLQKASVSQATRVAMFEVGVRGGMTSHLYSQTPQPVIKILWKT